jgi:ABC-2 type transport system permease protein
MRQLWSITRKELAGTFGSAMALIFVGAFLAVTLFSFFWVDAFFARGVADVRPLFHWMPLLLIFLVGALTMRQWSEEQRSGTLEMLLTLPVSPLRLVLGKFLAVMTLVAISLALTLFLPITVAILGPLDWGPVIGGYLAALLLAGAYAAIGLFVSSRTDNQIVALIGTFLLGGAFYLVGSGPIVNLAGERLGEVLRAIGSSSRFESIQRGVIDLRDLLYYLSLTGIFLALNVLSLESKRWGRGIQTQPYRRGMLQTTALVLANLLVLNVWLAPLYGLRVDLTAQREYSLSRTTRELLQGLQEPLLIRGYFSEKTHPLLAPLVPRIRDMLEEYRVAAGGKLQLEIVDPTRDPEIESEANQVYGIHPQPFQVAGRYETSIINSYFHILVRYGDKNTVLGFRDLIQVDARPGGEIEVRLRNLEYDLTSAIKKVVYGFQSVEAVLAAMDQPAELTLYLTSKTLPESLAKVPDTIETVATKIADQAPGHLVFHKVDLDAPDSPVTREQLYGRYGLRPFPVSIFSQDTYYLHLLLRVGDQAQVLYPTADMTEGDLRTAIESALKRASPGFLKVVGLWTPPASPTTNFFGQMQQPLSSWQELRNALRQEYEVRNVDLKSGRVPDDVDVLLLIAPQAMTDTERFAVDQFLMRGGSVIAAAGNYQITVDPFGGGLALEPLEDGLQELLAAYGIHVQQALVLDPQNEPFPVFYTRNVGGIQVREIRAINYPFFVDVRRSGMDADSPIVSNLPAVTLSWASPITVNETLNAGRKVTPLLRSSPNAWLQLTSEIQPNFDLYPDYGFPVGEKRDSYLLGVAVQGVFQSAFKDRPPALPGSEAQESGAPAVIESSPETARLVVFGSAEFVDDLVFEISQNLSGDRYLNNLKLVQNAVSWATEDMDLLSIRARGTSARVLKPLSREEESFWEAANYAVALCTLGGLGAVWSWRRRRAKPLPLPAIHPEVKR